MLLKAFDTEFILTEDTGVKSYKQKARPKETLSMPKDHNCQQYLTNMRQKYQRLYCNQPRELKSFIVHNNTKSIFQSQIIIHPRRIQLVSELKVCSSQTSFSDHRIYIYLL